MAVRQVTAFVDASPCPSSSRGGGTSRWAPVPLTSSEHPAQRRATSAQPVHVRARGGAGVLPPMSDRASIPPNPLVSSRCPELPAYLPYRLVGGVVLQSIPVAFSRPPGAYA